MLTLGTLLNFPEAVSSPLVVGEYLDHFVQMFETVFDTHRYLENSGDIIEINKFPWKTANCRS